MDSQPKRSSTSFEYFLYAAMVAETALAATIYKVIFHSGELVRVRVYFAIFYFAFLGWVIKQLNRLHRDRKSALPDATPVAVPVEQEYTRDDADRFLGLSGAQLIIVMLVFATAVAAFSWALRILR